MVTVEGEARGVNPSLSRRRWLGYAGIAALLLVACARLPLPGRADRPTSAPANAAPAAEREGRQARDTATSTALASGAPSRSRSGAAGANGSVRDASLADAGDFPSPAIASTEEREAQRATLKGEFPQGVDPAAADSNASDVDASAEDEAMTPDATTAARGLEPSAAASARPKVEGSQRQKDGDVPVWWKSLAALLLIAIPLLLIFLRKRRSTPMNDLRKPDATPLPGPVGAAGSAGGFMPQRSKTGVHMLSASEVWGPNHASHRAPWEAPSSAEEFAHLYKLGGDISPGLLFVGTEGGDEDATLDMPQRSVLADAVYAGMRDVAQPSVPATLEPAIEVQHDASHHDDAHDATVVARDTSVLHDAPAGVHSGEPALFRIEPDHTVVPNAREPSPGAAPAPAQHVAEHPVAVPLVDVAFLGTPLEASTRREPAPIELPDAKTQSAPVEIPAGGPAPNSSRADALADARALLGTGAHLKAIDRLSGLLQDPDAGIDAWVLASWAWWRIAQESDAPAAYARAAEAMEEVLKRDPEQRDGWHRVGSCRLLQAERETGSQRQLALEQGIAALRRVVDAQGQAVSPDVQAQLADALMRRARADDDRDAAQRHFAEAVEILRSASRASRNPASPLAWKLQQVLQAQARLLPHEAASKLHREADAILDAGLHAVAQEDRGAWYAARVENELTHAALADGATRMLHLRSFRERYAQVLTGPDATPDLLLSWLELLALETSHLRGAAAHARLDEGEAILARIDAMLPGNLHVAHARSRLLRRRASHSIGAARVDALTSALQSLQASLERVDSPELKLEAADVLLERAALLPQAQRQEDCRGAEALAAALCERPALAGQALSTLIEGRLLESDDPIDASLCARRLGTVPLDLRAHELLARAALRNGQPQIACAHCEAAAQLADGRLDSGFKSLWGDASRQWAAMPGAQRDPQWQANRQRLRAAG